MNKVLFIVIFLTTACSSVSLKEEDAYVSQELISLNSLKQEIEQLLKRNTAQNLIEVQVKLDSYVDKLIKIIYLETRKDKLQTCGVAYYLATGDDFSNLKVHSTLPQELSFVEMSNGIIAESSEEYQLANYHYCFSDKFYPNDMAKNALLGLKLSNKIQTTDCPK